MTNTEQIPIAAKSLASLEKYVGRSVPLKGYSSANAILINSYSGEQQLWVSPSFAGYKNAWVKAFGSLPTNAQYDVDHIYTKVRAQMYGYQYVRLALVDHRINRGNGAGIEKMWQKIPIPPDYTLPDIRYADYTQELKLQHISLTPSKKYSEKEVPGKAILGRPVPQPSPSAPPVRKPTVKTTGPARPASSSVPKVRSTPATVSHKLRCVPVDIQRAGKVQRVVVRPKSYGWSANVLEWIMGGLVALSNRAPTQEALDKILAGTRNHIPPGGGVLVALVYKEPNNASQYGFSTQYFMYAYVMGYGRTAQEAHQKYQAELTARNNATISPGTQEGWHKVEHLLWFTAAPH
ncbi:hypothetical protein [Archangium lipolyticum]|uniref:hypothetical protein n=1 Tax=Archangium lipolyticum TaxID=2970465 RepID=UPI00214A3A48|nr:hypothetical protein [Archangium lipolyticum]